MVVVLLHNEAGRIHVVHPGGHLLVVGALAGDGVHQDGPLDVGAAEEADGLDHPGGDPPGAAVLVDLELGRAEHVGGVLEAQVAHDVAVEGLREGVFHPVLQAHHSGLLGDHVHDDIGGQALGAVGEPLDEVGIGDGGDPDGAALVVDLGGVVGVFKLADHVAEGAHLAVAQEVGGVLVQGGDLTKGNLGDVLGEIAILHGEQIPVGRGAEKGHREDGAHDGHRDQGQKQDAHRQALGLDEAEVLLGASTAADHIHAGGDQGADDIHHTQDADEGVKIAGLQVDGGQGHIEVEEAHHSGDDQIDQDLPQLACRASALLGRLLFHKNILLLFRGPGGQTNGIRVV